MNFGLMSSNVHSINNVSFIFLTKKQTNKQHNGLLSYLLSIEADCLLLYSGSAR